MNKLLGLFGAVFASILLLGSGAAAQGVNDFVIKDFTADYYLSDQDKQGILEVRETIVVDFSGSNHGILRAIPRSYKGQSLKLHINSVKYLGAADSGGFTIYTENDNTVLKIGNPDKTVTGEQTYEISYRLDNVIGFYDEHDEFYWDINGDQWQQPFESVTARLHLPIGVKSNEQLDCFTGAFGSTDDYCVISQDKGVITAQTTAALTASQTLTIVAGFNKGYFQPATFTERLLDNLPTILKVSLPTLLVGGYAARRWWKKGRDPKGRGTIVAQYDAPDGLRAAEVGTITDFRTDQREITATILDLAIRGYIKIIEEKKVKRLARDTLEYSVELLKSDTTGLKNYEVTLLKGLFPAMKVGDLTNFKDLKNKFYVHVASANKEVVKNLVDTKYFRSNPTTSGGRLWALVVLLIILVAALGSWLGPAFIIGCSLATIPVFIFAMSMPARTDKGVEAKEHAMGLKLYLETAEEDRIRMMQSPDAPYFAEATNGKPYTRTAAPKKTVELYEKLLPYAIIFSVEKQWSEEFKNIYTTEPSWYSGSNYTAFNTVYLASALNGSMSTAMGTAFSSPSSSSGSGGGGGGFSGGGGGGGGGGGW